MFPGSSVPILKSVVFLEVFQILCVSERPPRTLRGHARFLTVVNGVSHIRNAVCMSPGSSVSILKTLASLEVPRLLGVSTASSKESKRTCLVPDGFQWYSLRQE